MNQLRRVVTSIGIGAMALLGAQGIILAQPVPQENPAVHRKGEVLGTKAQQGSLAGGPAERPELPETMPQAVKDRLRQFESKREQYLAQQLELMHRLNKVSDADRAQLREQLKEQRQAWLEEAKKIREQARARLQEMKRELSNHGEVLEAAREQVREQVRDKVREQIRDQTRERRGTD